MLLSYAAAQRVTTHIYPRVFKFFSFDLYNEYITNQVFEGLQDFKRGGEVILSVKYAAGFVLLAKKETVLQGMFDRLIETGRSCGMEMNVEKTKLMRTSREPFP